MEAPIIVFEVIYSGPAWLTVGARFTTTIEAATEEEAREEFKKFYPRATLESIKPKQ